MPRVLGVHGIAQQYRSGPELTPVWSAALRGGLEVAGFRATADGLAETDVRVAFFGDLFRPKGAMAGGEPPYTPADVKPGPERDLLEIWYEAAVEQEPSLGPPPGAMGPGMGPGRVAAQAMLEQLLRSRSFGAIAAAASVLGTWGALTQLSDAARLVVPWGWLLTVVGAAAAVALLASLLPARLALHQPPVQLAGVRE